MLTMGLRVNSGLSRLAVTAFDAVFSLLLAVVWISCTAPSAFAYVDPSVMTYTIQALAGVAVALSAVLGVVWRRVRRFLLRVLRIDENAGKVDDGVVRRLDVDAPDYADRVEGGSARRARHEGPASRAVPRELVRSHTPRLLPDRLLRADVHRRRGRPSRAGRFESVEPVLHGRGRLGAALRCARSW